MHSIRFLLPVTLYSFFRNFISTKDWELKMEKMGISIYKKF